MTTETKKYAIRCSTEEQSIECHKHGYGYVLESYPYKEIHGNPVITYEEAVGLGLLGEKLKEVAIENDIIYQMDSYEKEEVKEESKIDKIIEEADRLSQVGAMDYFINIPRITLRMILEKHLNK